MMLEVRHRQIQILSERFSEQGLAAKEFIDALVSAEYHSRISSALAQECSVHLYATAQLLSIHLTELSAWSASRPSGQDARTARIEQLGWDFAVGSIERCISAVAVHRAEQMWALAKVIADKTIELMGWQQAKSLMGSGNNA